MDNFVEYLRYGGYASAIISAILFVLAIVLFFRYDIRGIINELSGKSKADLTQRMSSEYEKTGSLRRSSGALSGEIGRSSGNTDMLDQTGLMSGKTREQGKARKVSRNKTASTERKYKIIKENVVIHTAERI